MTTDVVSVEPDATFKDVVERLVGAGVSGLPVVDDRGALLGIITEADLSPRRRIQGTVRGRSACSRTCCRARAPLGHQGEGVEGGGRHDRERGDLRAGRRGAGRRSASGTYPSRTATESLVWSPNATCSVRS
jgi:hypothetical protein